MQKIPKVIHQIWLGGKPLPQTFQKYRETWVEKNPEWDFILWTEKNLNNIGWLDRKKLDILCHPAIKSDYLRFLIIKEFGGVYIDIDFECLKPLNTLLNDVGIFIGEYREGEYLPNGFFGANKNHKLIQEICTAMKIRISKKNILKHPLNTLIWPVFIDKYFRWYKWKDLKIFKKEIFYPIHWSIYYPGITIPKNLLAVSFAHHHAAASWVKMTNTQRLKQKLLTYKVFQITYKYVWGPLKKYMYE